MQSTAALAIFFLALPALSSSVSAEVSSASVAAPSHAGSPSGSHHTVAGTGAKAAGQGTDKQHAQKLVSTLHAYHKEVESELDACAKANGITKCLTRINGPISGTLSGEALKQAKLTYHKKLGEELAQCAKQTKDLKGCMDKSTAKSDKFQKRGGVSDFFTGFVQGFTNVFQAAAPVLSTVASFL